MRLKYIETADFRKSEFTNFVEIQRKTKLELEHDDCVLLISYSGNQLLFVYGFSQLEKGRTALRSERLRLSRGTWEPTMLQNYAEVAGIHLDGIKRFEEHYRRLRGVEAGAQQPNKRNVQISRRTKERAEGVRSNTRREERRTSH